MTHLKSSIVLLLCLFSSYATGQYQKHGLELTDFNTVDLALDTHGRLIALNPEGIALTFNGKDFIVSDTISKPYTQENIQETELTFSSTGIAASIQKNILRLSTDDATSITLDTIIEPVLDIVIDPWKCIYVLKEDRSITQYYPTPLRPSKNTKFSLQDDLKTIWHLVDGLIYSTEENGRVIRHDGLGQGIVKIALDRYQRLWILRPHAASCWQYTDDPLDIQHIKTVDISGHRDSTFYVSNDSDLFFTDTGNKIIHRLCFSDFKLVPIDLSINKSIWGIGLSDRYLHAIHDQGIWSAFDLKKNDSYQVAKNVQDPYRGRFQSLDRDIYISSNYTYSMDNRTPHFVSKLKDVSYNVEDEYDPQPAQIISWRPGELENTYRIDAYHPFAKEYIKLDINGINIPKEYDQLVNVNSLSHGNHSISYKSAIDGYPATTTRSHEVSLSVYHPWHKRTAILAGLGSLLLISGIGFLVYRDRHRKQQDELKRKQYQQKIKMAQLERSALQLQMNPHFIFNTLNTIRATMRSGKTDQADDIIQNFSSLMRGQLDMSRKNKTSIDDEVKLIDHYLSLERAARNNSFDYHITGDINALFDVDIPTMLLQPIVENAIVHGVAAKKEGGLITVHFEDRKNILRITVEDNGPGFSSESTSAHQSVASQVIDERLGLIPGASVIRRNKEGSESGAVVILNLPI